MIVLNILCDDCSNEFEGWFDTHSSCQTQIKKSLVECTRCGSTNVNKGLSAPNVSLNKSSDINKNKVMNELRSKIKDVQSFVEKNAEYVGDNFTYEARRIHYDKLKKKPIYGTASKEDVKDLQDEGIDVATIPWIEKKEN